MSSSITFRLLRRADFGLLTTWLNEPLVSRWWNHETSAEAVERDFGPSIDRIDPTELFIANFSGRPFGLIQRYRIDDNPEYLAELGQVYPTPPGALSADYFIGEPAFRGRGLGAAMISELVADSWSAYPDATVVVIPVCAGNRASWRALELAGFERVAEGELAPDNPIDPRDHVIYACSSPN